MQQSRAERAFSENEGSSQRGYVDEAKTQGAALPVKAGQASYVGPFQRGEDVMRSVFGTLWAGRKMSGRASHVISTCECQDRRSVGLSTSCAHMTLLTRKTLDGTVYI